MNYFLIFFVIITSVRCDPTLKCTAEILNFYSSKTDQIFIDLDYFSKIFNYSSILQYFGSIPIRNLNFELNAKKVKQLQLETAITDRFQPTIFVILIENNLQELIYLRSDVVWNPKAKFILITSNINFDELDKFLKENFMENFVILKNEEFFSWIIQDLSLTYPNFSNLISPIGNCSNITQLFPKRVYTDYTKLTVRYGFLDVKPYSFFDPPNSTNAIGIEINLFELLTELMGFNVTFVMTEHAYIYALTPESAWDILRYNKTDLYFGKYLNKLATS